MRGGFLLQGVSGRSGRGKGKKSTVRPVVIFELKVVGHQPQPSETEEVLKRFTIILQICPVLVTLSISKWVLPSSGLIPGRSSSSVRSLSPRGTITVGCFIRGASSTSGAHSRCTRGMFRFSKMSAAASGMVLRKKDRSRVCIARFIGGRKRSR